MLVNRQFGKTWKFVGKYALNNNERKTVNTSETTILL